MLQEAATVAIRFDANARFRMVERAIDDREVGHSTISPAADGNAVAVAIGAVGNENI